MTNVLDNDLVITGLTIYAEVGIKSRGSIVLRQGKIHAMLDEAIPVIAKQQIVFPATYHLVPGFIDMHVHGAQGHDVMDATVEALQTIQKTLLAEGTTGFLATTMTATLAETEAALLNIQSVMATQKSKQGAKILGIHLEGPFIAEKKTGAQRQSAIIEANVELFKRWQLLSGRHIKLVTLAPESLQNLDFIEYLVAEQVLVSMGHSDATYSEAMAAIASGCTYATHLFNAMRALHHREPGIAGAALLSPAVTCELIVDGVHLHPAIVELTFKMKGKDKIVLVTDAMRAKCLADGCYDLGGQAVQVVAGVPRLTDGTLAGSVLTLSAALRNMRQFSGCQVIDLVAMTATNPAKLLGVYSQKGSIAVNKDADLVVLDDKLNVVMTISAGEVVYQASLETAL